MRSTEEILSKSGFTEKEMELFLAMCYGDYIYFAENVLGFDISDYHREWYELLEKYSRLGLEAFRGSGKTNFVAGFYIWKAIFSPKTLNFLIVSNTFEQSKMVLKIIRTMLADNDILKSFVPEGRDATWKATELTTTNGCTFYCKPYSENVKGLRIDYLLCDEGGQYEDKSIFWKAISPVVQLNRGRICVIGTPESHIDLLSELENNDEYFFKKYPSEVDGNVMWDKKYTNLPYDTPTQRSLKNIRKEIGELAYMQEYLLVPISSANSLFPLDMIMKCLDSTQKFLPFGKMNEKYYVGVDLANSKEGDWTVFTVISANADGNKLVYADRSRCGFKEQKEKLHWIVEMFRPGKICIDKTGLGEEPVKQLCEEIPGIEPVHFTYDEKFKLIMDLRHEFETFHISLPNSKDDNGYDFTQTLLKELSDFVLKVDLENRNKTRTKFGSGKYDDCFVAGTKVLTPSGQKPIESLGIGDEVITRNGPRKIIATKQRLAEVVNNCGLTGTPEHPIITPSGIKKLKYLKDTDVTYIWNQKRSIIEEKRIIDIPTQKEGNYDYTTGIMEKQISRPLLYTDKYGLIISEKLRRVLSSITKMGIPLTTTSKILKYSESLTTHHYTQQQKRDAIRLKELRGIEKRLKKLSEMVGGKVKNSENRVKKILRSLETENTININALSAAENIQTKELHAQNSVQENAKIKRIVYNIQVEKDEEYFANNILVHNCVISLSLANRAAQNSYGQVSVGFI